MPDVTLARGQQGQHQGRPLTATDTGIANALVPLAESGAPLKLKLGDRLTLAATNPTGGAVKMIPTTVTITITGFYTGETSPGQASHPSW